MIYDKLPIVLLSTIASEKSDSINNQIAIYVLENIETVQNIGIKDLALKCNVGISSISRFCRDIGLKDFAELRELLKETNLFFEDSLSLNPKVNLQLNYANKVISSIDMVAESVDMNMISKLCEDIRSFKNVSAFGLLKAGGVAVSLQADLLMLGKRIDMSISYSQQVTQLFNSGPDDLIIIFSYTGSYFDYQNIRELRRRLLKSTIWLISSAIHPSLNFIDYHISFNSLGDQNSHPYQLQFVSGLIAQEYSRKYKNSKEL